MSRYGRTTPAGRERAGTDERETCWARPAFLAHWSTCAYCIEFREMGHIYGLLARCLFSVPQNLNGKDKKREARRRIPPGQPTTELMSTEVGDKFSD